MSNYNNIVYLMIHRYDDMSKFPMLLIKNWNKFLVNRTTRNKSGGLQNRNLKIYMITQCLSYKLYAYKKRRHSLMQLLIILSN